MSSLATGSSAARQRLGGVLNQVVPHQHDIDLESHGALDELVERPNVMIG